jgi:hypothetical protein
MAVYLTVDAALLTFVAVLLSGPQPARALPAPAPQPLGDKAASDRAWGWWEQPPYLSWTEEEPPPEPPEPPLILLEDEPWKGGRAATATARASPRPRPHVPYDSTFMQAVEDWTPRMKREFLREKERAVRADEELGSVKQGWQGAPPSPPDSPGFWYWRQQQQDELQRNAMEALERIGYWDMLKLGIATIPGWGDATPVPSPAPATVYTDLGVDESWAAPFGDEWSWREYDYTYHDYDYEPPKRYPSHDYDYDDVPPTPGWTHDYSESWSSHYDAEPGYEDVYPREPKLGEYPYDDYGAGAPEEGEEGEFDWMAARFLEWF